MTSPHLNRLLTLEEPERVPDGAGGFTETWVAKGTLWAEVNGRTARETGSNFVTTSKVSYYITVRGAAMDAPSRPKADQRFVDGSRIFRITGVKEADPQGRYLLCFANEEVVT